MPATRQELFDFLDRLGIHTTTVDHAPLHTVADSQALRGEISGGHTRNLFLRDRKDRHFLLTVEEDATVDLKQIHHVIGASGRVSFGKPEVLYELLGVLPGSVTVFGLINDTAGKVTAFLDAGLMESHAINTHPLVNTATTTIARDDLLRFIAAAGHEAKILKLTA